MENARASLIIAALFVVLLSAFGAERACHGSRLCLNQTAANWLPGARFGLGGQDGRQDTEEAARQLVSGPER